MGNKDRGSSHAVSVVGYSLRAPSCSSVPEFAKALARGRDLTTSNTRYPAGFMGLPPRQGRLNEKDVSDFNPSFFGMSVKQAQAMDPAIRILLQVSYEALMDAQINIDSLRGSNTGVYVGHVFSDSSSLLTSSINKDKNGYEIVNGAHSMAANRLSYFYDLHGPSMVIDTACSSSLVALDRAVRDLRDGIVDRAIVGGLSLTLNHHKNASFNEFKMLSPSGHCFAFDSRANGYCRSDGIACVILERGREGYAVIRGSGTNNDGATEQGITYPSGRQQVSLMRKVFADSKVDSRDVGYHEAHGTGTIAGDREECGALSSVYSHPIQIGSVKSNMGHAEGASGLFGLIKILLMYEDRKLYPNFDFRSSPHAMIQDGKLSVVQTCLAWEPVMCTLSNFGFGGSNTFVVVEPASSPKRMLTGSSRQQSNRPFASTPAGPMPSLSNGDFYMAQRHLGNHAVFGYEWNIGGWVKRSCLVFVCDGQGSQWNNMGQDLMQKSPVFRRTIERLQIETGMPLVELYNDGSSWMMKKNSVIGIVSYQLGLLAVLQDSGIRPDFFLGHSLGETVCGYLAGFLSEAEVLRVAQVRSNMASLIDTEARLDVYDFEPAEGYDFATHSDSGAELWARKVASDGSFDSRILKSFSMKGSMAVVGCESNKVENAISELNLQETRVACYNAPKGQTISGAAFEVNRLLEKLKHDNPSLFIRLLPTDGVAYHAPYLSVFQNYLRESFGDISAAPLPSSWISTSQNGMFGTDYLIQNICGPVYFEEGINSLPTGATIVEIGPSSGLLAQVKRIRQDLTLIGIAEREKPVDVDAVLRRLEPWVNAEPAVTTDEVETKSSKALRFEERYPDIWGGRTTLQVPTWKEFELPRTLTGSPEVSYDLSKPPWSSIRDHQIRGQNLFPAVGFLHALWSVHDFGLVEIVDFRIDTPLVIPTGSEKVKFQVRQAGTHCYICDSLGEVCYASGRVKPAPPTARPTEHSPVQGQDGIEKEYFYPHLRRLGYEYGTSYQLLDNITAEHASLTKQPVDWISYLDACLHLELHNCSCLGYPVGFDRVILWERSLENAALWVKKISADSLGNSSIILDGLKMEYVPDSPLLPSIYKETFVEYDDCDVLHEPHVVAALLLRESATFCVVEPLLSTELQAIVHCLRECSMSRETKLEIWVVVSDRITADADLLLTTDKERPMFSYIPVARWGELRLLRGGNGVKIGKLKVAKNWNEVPMSGPFLWTGDGSSGAVASVVAERGQTAISYEGATNGLIGLEKQMRHNYFNKDGQHGVWVDVKQPGCTSAEGPTSPNAELRIGRPGLLDSLVWHVIDPKRHSVKIKFATLNFRDVMRAMGQLKEKDLSLGLEFSGTEIASNKRVFGVARNSLSSHCSPAYSFPTPDNISDEEAATIPIVYLTAYFALFKKAKMTAGQSVLIHGGAGGVGMAAIRLAQKRGLTIFTTCSSGKRGYLKDHFRLSDAQIGDSRSETFIQTVLSGTRGRGVDVVLNHLSGSLQVASLRCVASGGHFCEIGKYDILQNTGLRQGLLARNVSFHVIDLLPLLMDSAMLSVWDSMLRNGFESNEIVPLPVTAFKVENVVDAFRFMSQGKHMGKIGIKGLDSHEFPVGHDALIAQQESHLITGGLGGLGLSLASRLASDGCREVILVGRRGVTTGFQRHQLASMEAMGCKVRIVKSDVLNLKPEMTVSVPDRIWHVATVYRDMAFDTMTKSAWDAVVRTKVDGYMCLRACWPSTPIVAISSVVAYYGNAGQTHYALANARLDSFARSDPNTLSVRLGPLDNVGFITKSDTGRALLERFPIKLMRVDDVLDRLLEVGIKNRCGVVGVYDLKQRGVSSLSKSGKRQASRQYTIEQAQQFVASILGGSAKDYSPQISLKSAGLDSLSTMEVVHHIHEMDRSTSFKASMITEEFTVQSIVDAVKAVKVDVGLDDDDKSSDLSIESGSAGPSTARENAQDVMTEAAGEDNTIHVQGDETERLLTLSNGIHGRILTSIEEGWTRRRVLVGAGLMLSTLWWICSLAAFDKGQAEHILLYSFIVCCGCDLVRLFVDWHMRNGNTVREPVSCSHYLQGVLSFIAYVLMFVIYPATFLRNWSSVYFGYYMYDNLSLLIFWDDINRAFRDFYALHHIISFTLTGFWRVPSGSWNVKLGMLVMLWLTSEIWQYSLYVFRHFAGHGKCTARKIAILGVVAFVSERLQRFSAYLLLFLLDDKITHRAWLVFATGIAFDVLDTYFQLKALHRQFSSVNPLPKSSERSFSESMLRQESPDIEMGEGWSSEPD